MSKEVKRILIIKIIQFLICGISVIGAFFNRESSQGWPIYLLIIGILWGKFVPIKYRKNFFSTDSGLLLKNHTRRLENIIDTAILLISIFLVYGLYIFRAL